MKVCTHLNGVLFDQGTEIFVTRQEVFYVKFSYINQMERSFRNHRGGTEILLDLRNLTKSSRKS